jgi:hypothetical protein
MIGANAKKREISSRSQFDREKDRPRIEHGKRDIPWIYLNQKNRN